MLWSVQAVARQIQCNNGSAADKALAGGAPGCSNANSDAIKQRIAGDTTGLQKRARQRAEAAKTRAADEEHHRNVLRGPMGGHFAEAAAIAHTLQPPSPGRTRARAKQLEPGSEQSYHMNATDSYMDSQMDGGTVASTAVGTLLVFSISLL